MPKRLLFVDDEPGIRVTLAAILGRHGFEVSTAATVSEALQKITSEKFDVLLSDLNIGNPADGLTVVSAMRRTQPEAVTMILTGYPAFETALEAIRQQVDDYIVKPADIAALVNAIENKLGSAPQPRHQVPPKRVAMLLQENLECIQELWLNAVQQDRLLSKLEMSREERLEHITEIVQEVIRKSQSYSGEEAVNNGSPARQHGSQREVEGYTPSTMLAEFCHLRRVLTHIIQDNLLAVNLSFLVPDLACVNESLDDQAQTSLAAMLKAETVS